MASAFTLVELLVVVAIIGLLLAIMAPSLSGAREAARRAACASNQHQIFLAMRGYLYNERSLPKLTRSLDARPPYESKQDLLVPWDRSAAIYHINNPVSGRDSEYVNFGLLWRQKLVSEIDVFGCPAQEHPEYTLGNPLNPWPPDPPRRLGEEATFKTWNDVFSAYNRRLGLSYESFDDLGSGTAIASDVNYFPVYARTHHRARGFNAVYADGSVDWITDPWFYDDDPSYEDFDIYDQVRHCLEVFERMDR